MAATEERVLPFQRLASQAEELLAGIDPQLKELRVVLRDVAAAERNELYRAAREQGEELFTAALRAAEKARYVLRVVEAQQIGNTSEAWHIGTKELREALEEVETLSPKPKT